MLASLLSGTYQLADLSGIMVKIPARIHYAGALLTPRTPEPATGLPSLQIRMMDARGACYILSFVQETPSRVRFSVARDE